MFVLRTGNGIIIKLDIERSYVSDAPFLIRIESRDAGGWRREKEISDTGNLGKRLEWGDADEN